MDRSAIIGLLLLVFAARTPLSPPFPSRPLPTGSRRPNGQYGTGLGVGDLDGDGWVDLVVANGNDMARQRVMVYRKGGIGYLPGHPTWTVQRISTITAIWTLPTSTATGFLDCAVAVYLGAAGFGAKGRVKLYREWVTAPSAATPSGNPADTFYCFSLAFGDIDMDGRPDLACATGDDYNDNPERRRVYRNLGRRPWKQSRPGCRPRTNIPST